MADFCMQCCRDIIGIPGGLNDFKGLSSREDSEKGLFTTVLCEGCGPIQVDDEGMCVSKDCIEKHNKIGEVSLPLS